MHKGASVEFNILSSNLPRTYWALMMIDLCPAQRSHIWACMTRDDPHQLMLALRLYGVHDLKTLRQLDLQLWQNGTGKDGSVPMGIMDACAYNNLNIPEQGAVKCLKTLLDKYGPMGFSASLQDVIDKCNAMDRMNLVKLIST